MKNDDVYTVFCAKCGAEYKIPAEYIGQDLICDHCNTVFTVPFPQGSQVVRDPYFMEPEEEVPHASPELQEEVMNLLQADKQARDNTSNIAIDPKAIAGAKIKKRTLFLKKIFSFWKKNKRT